MKPDVWITGYIGESPNTAAELEAPLPDGPATIAINSPGGVATEGAAIHALLQSRASDTALVIGIAASAATLPMIAADRILIHSAAMIMIHEPSAMTIGPAGTHRKAADDLEKMADVYAATYASATGHPKSRIARWMEEETWMTAEEAVDLNFADEVWDGESEAVARFDYSKFKNAPKALVQMAIKNGWAAEVDA